MVIQKLELTRYERHMCLLCAPIGHILGERCRIGMLGTHWMSRAKAWTTFNKLILKQC